ncbi:MAG TPA: WHG domain-containing protein, partial [Clostridiaceae bacterium]|nr:WHG domain-containing protein [Clostridiaceae bacterium]
KTVIKISYIEIAVFVTWRIGIIYSIGFLEFEIRSPAFIKHFQFTSLINEALAENEDDCLKQIMAVSKLYVKFMVENPEHFKFIFMTDHHNPIILKNGKFIKTDRWIVSVLENLFIGLRKNESSSESSWSLDALTIWSLIHGFTTMLVNNTIKYEGDYLDAVSLMLKEKVKILE